MLPTVPILLTERLILREYRREDFLPYAALWADPEITRFISTAPASEEEAWARFLRYPGHWTIMGFGTWAVEERATGRTIGHVGFADYRRAMTPALDGPEIGWVLARSAAGAGYATEAVRAAVAWGDQNFDGRATACMIMPEHRASIRVADKTGYRPVGTAVYKGKGVTTFTREGAAAQAAPGPHRPRSLDRG